ncbi:MAG: LuxR C-terminal-related transcriptional regulator [Elainellaceae cyanobacterium]
MLDSARLLLGLQRASEIAQALSGCIDPDAIAKRVTDGLVEKFGCAFARIWLVESDQTALRLVASSGMYTHINGSFACVPMGAFKVGKIAQNRVSFLSNTLHQESWVKDRDWAIANQICGFAGYPLATEHRVIGVLAVFSREPMEPEFLEILQNLCTTVTIALETTLQSQREKQVWQTKHLVTSTGKASVSDQLAEILTSSRLTLVGTERPLSFALARVFLQAGETLSQMDCSYCRLTYENEHAVLEAIVASSKLNIDSPHHWIRSAFGDLLLSTACLGGELDTRIDPNKTVIQISLKVPYSNPKLGSSVYIRCQQSVLQMAFTHLAYLGGLTVLNLASKNTPLLTDDISYISKSARVLWIQQDTQTLPAGISAHIDLSISPIQLREAVEVVLRGETWGIEPNAIHQQLLSEREREIMSLLAQGLRDRDIANQLFISESTVKFHIGNILAKLKARNRYQAVYQATLSGWISERISPQAIADS